MRALAAITGMSIRQLIGLRRFIIFSIAALAPAAVLLLLSQALADEAALNRLLAMVVALYFPLLVPIVTLIIASSALGDERRDGTLSFLVLRPIPRSIIVFSKFLATMVVAGGLNGVGAVALTAVYGIETGSWNLVIPLVLASFAASVVYASLFIPLGFFTDRSVLIGLAYVFIFENAVVSALSGLSTLSPWRIGMSVFAGLVPDNVTAEIADIEVANLSSLGAAILWTVLIGAASIAATTLLLRRRDLT